MSRIVAALAIILIAACSGGSGGVPDARGGDAGVDAAVIDAFSCASCVAPVDVCNQPAHRCDQCAGAPDCADLSYTQVCSGGACRECAGNSDCTAASLGPTCDTTKGVCTCSGAADCAGNGNGTICDLGLGACTCGGDGDCLAGTCQAQPYLGPGAKTCQ